MKKLRIITLLAFIFGAIILLPSCTKDDNSVTGYITYGPEHKTAMLASVELVNAKTDETYSKTTTDLDGYYEFYPVDNGTYYIYAHYTALDGTEYDNVSENFTLVGTTDKTINLNLLEIVKK